jgi:methionine-rich copper-binding protein CopC
MLAVAVALLLVPSLVFAGTHKFVAAKAIAQESNTVVVPLEITNEANLTAMDIPLQYSAGVKLRTVDFTGTRVENWDLKAFNIDQQNHRVVIGLFPKMSANGAPDLQAGSGTVAKLVFEVTDPTVQSIQLTDYTSEKPNHRLMFIYHTTDENGQIDRFVERPDFQGTTVALSGIGSNLPDEYALSQNYPNPFNPSTNISFALPEANHVRLDIYNVLGQKVETLLDENMPAGNHEVEWHASTAASGVYFYRLEAGTFSETKKMMYLK